MYILYTYCVYLYTYIYIYIYILYIYIWIYRWVAKIKIVSTCVKHQGSMIPTGSTVDGHHNQLGQSLGGEEPLGTVGTHDRPLVNGSTVSQCYTKVNWQFEINHNV